MIRSNAEKDALRQEREKDLERSNDGAFCRIVVFDRYVEQDLIQQGQKGSEKRVEELQNKLRYICLKQDDGCGMSVGVNEESVDYD